MSKKLAFIGGGNMAEALIAGLLREHTLTPAELLVCEKSPERRAYLENQYRIETAAENARGPQQASTLFLAVKPKVLAEIQEEIRGALTPDHLVISILAGISRERLAEALGHPERMVRVMPNLPAQVGRGVSAITFPATLPESGREWVRTIFRSVGEVVEVEESLQDAVTAVSGSGPGYIFYLAQVFIDAAVREGLSRPVARRLVTETLAGAAEVLRRKEDSPEELVRKVATPGGTTEAGLAVLLENDLAGTFQTLVARAAQRSRELGRPLPPAGEKV
ncbi:MAG TPA: pyrroline-5-carboxylate reductase [bacterium]|nr:pyrroline-5-carboxylate reductase [Candidatus Omnitrophota bacterium]HOJ58993.1 pyrroline-5-carboxylate reductase [bacterium]HOL95873.1 pyrroline-5-carboxylate reductase [bacterium]HPO99910.1 pyrroline-5-carboxylate reductase [bacterium]HXK95222.1 pyrroline-5-carboxylate reductase [bacterium]